ncbi:hypothetical protein OQ708_23345, partial [Mycobacterium ulcerans]|nr:hypothetical protein [Mycobacterium ulcerans]MEB3911138.1 hypothetical protein [Mycobacterium ulcerans]MEB3921379.1 hypothetical protein [Mycobacterium ulcerans]MEB3925498.1 hypothetical protein [Mycobacterium ulcerans]MEB3929653.1 hypothetical protein [Mycobacterium ulcerans]
QPPPRPPQSTIPQLTSLLINNAGALANRGTYNSGADSAGHEAGMTSNSGVLNIGSNNAGFLNYGNYNSGFRNTVYPSGTHVGNTSGFVNVGAVNSGFFSTGTGDSGFGQLAYYSSGVLNAKDYISGYFH